MQNKLENTLRFGVITLCLWGAEASAYDARAVALGGSAITNGHGVHGVFSNPATLMHLRRSGQGRHLRLSADADIRDPGKFLEIAINNQTFISDINNNIISLQGNLLECLSTNITTDTVCIRNTEAIGANFENALSIAETISQRPFEILAQAQGGLAYSKSRHPFAIHLNLSVAGAGEVAVSENDLNFLTVFQNTLIDGQLTVGEIANSIIDGQQILSINPSSNNILEIDQPQDVLTSTFTGTQLTRRQIGISLGYGLLVANRTLDIGITPKISSLTTKRAAGMIASEFDTTTPSITDDFQDSQVNTTTFTLDAGATYTINDELSISVVGRNLIPEVADTSLEGFTIKTTPQIITGVSFRLNNIVFNADAALNTAELDGVMSQPFGIGAELGSGSYFLRTGISIDTGRIADKAAFTLGFGLGVLQLGARISSLNAIQAGAQLSFPF